MPYITLTGADDTTQPEALWRLAESSNFGTSEQSNVEFGILYSVSNQGVGRYPSFEWIEKLTEKIKAGPGPGFSLHVCGRAVHDFIAGSGHVSEVASAFDRIQINFRSSDFTLAEIGSCISRNSSKTIITQRNEANRHLFRGLAHLNNHAVLFDESGGRGKSPETWDESLEVVNCGYAGGLGPDNLAAELPRIHAAAKGMPYWVDMEGKIRDENDRFDLNAAQQCLEIAGQFHQDCVVEQGFSA